MDIIWALQTSCTDSPSPRHPNGHCRMLPGSQQGRGFPPEPAAKAHRQTPKGFSVARARPCPSRSRSAGRLAWGGKWSRCCRTGRTKNKLYF